ncbi:unnamed protein product [Didymodactylos carnosus]|uniref:Uncharacterized protein n=1 Tax=Didymodactylos carnosus TaxID=1234261 RepID=A0A813UY94_9BILA|nr:unnamed protein product [Didymodactylos carnosus]CAF3617034.1 unnamed protein product [Didymodactylos carnosus]
MNDSKDDRRVSVQCSLQLWSLKFPGIHEKDISVHSYQQKPVAKPKLLDHRDQQQKKPAYYDEYHSYYESRFMPFHISNKLFQNLRDKLNELDQLMTTLKCIKIIWLCYDTVWLAFSNGTYVFIFIDKTSRTLKKIVIDKTTLKKKLNITDSSTTICDIYLNGKGIYVLYDNLSKFDIMKFSSAIKNFEKFSLSNENVKIYTHEIPIYAIKRKMIINEKADLLTVWWSSLSTRIDLVDNNTIGQTKANVLCLSMNDDGTYKVNTLQTETSAPYYCSSTSTGLTTIELSETITTNNSPTYDFSIYYYENFRSLPLRLVHVQLPSTIVHVIRSTSYTVMYLSNCQLVCINEFNHVQRSKQCLLTRNVTGLWWTTENLLFIVSDENGSLLFYDIALNPIWPILTTNNILNFHSLGMDKTCSLVNVQPLSSIVNSSSTSNTSNITLLFLFSNSTGLFDLHLPISNLLSLVKFYLKCQQYSYIIDLLWCLDWSHQDYECRIAMSITVNELLKYEGNHIEYYLEQIFRTFYSPLRPISDVSIIRNRQFVTQLAKRFFYYLLRLKSFTKAYLLAKDIHLRALFIDLYYECDRTNDLTVMNECVKEIHELKKVEHEADENEDDSSPLTASLNGDTDGDRESLSAVSVTSSDDEDILIKAATATSTPSIHRQNEETYGDIREIINSAINHYKLDENMCKLLAERVYSM